MKTLPHNATLFAGMLLILSACSKAKPPELPTKPVLPDPMVSGKRLSQWTDQLEDRDPETMKEALRAIQKVPPAESERAREPLRKCWPGRSLSPFVIAEIAVTRQELFAEVSPAYFGSLLSALEYGDRDQALGAAMVLKRFPERADEIVDRSIKVLTRSEMPLWRTLDASGLLDEFGTQALPKLEALPEPEDLMTQVAVGSLIKRIKISHPTVDVAPAEPSPIPEPSVVAISTPVPTWTPPIPDPEAERWIRLANDAALVAEQWKERAIALQAHITDLANLPPEPYIPPPADAATAAETARRLFGYHDARGKAWRARAQSLEAHRTQSAAR